MINGFYNTDKLTIAIKKRIINEAIGLSFHIICEEKYRNNISTREIYPDLSINKLISEGTKNNKGKLGIVNRIIYNKRSFDEKTDYEICFHYDWKFLYIYLNEQNFNFLIKKYKLELLNF